MTCNPGNCQQCSAIQALPGFVESLVNLALLPYHRDGEEELVSQALEAEPAPTKLAFAAAAGSIILVGASAICWLCGTDPLGGASLSPHSLKAAEVGEGFSLATMRGQRVTCCVEPARPIAHPLNRLGVASRSRLLLAQLGCSHGVQSSHSFAGHRPTWPLQPHCIRPTDGQQFPTIPPTCAWRTS